MSKIDDMELEAAKDRLIQEMQDSGLMLAGVILTKVGVRGYNVGKAGAMELAQSAFVLRHLSDNILKTLSENVGEVQLQEMWEHMEKHFQEGLTIVSDQTEVIKGGE